MSQADVDYFTAFENLVFDRSDNGVLLVRIHTNGGPAVFTGTLHRDITRALTAISEDRENRVLVLTGTGDNFITEIDMSSGGEVFKPQVWDPVLWEGRKALERFADLPMPFIAAVNGPATVHSEWALLADITIVSETASFRDDPHLDYDIVPGDGVHVVWEELLGLNRARYAALTQQRFEAEEALRLGMVNEVLPEAEVLPRAMELAAQLASRPQLLLRYTPIVLRQRLARRIQESATVGLALEGLTMADKPYQG